VRCELVLDDGRTVTLQHDLDGKVDCRATDERGIDLSAEIMYDGAPDGSVWLGLNRRTFGATACINQTEMLRVLEAADALQTDIQRAAATAGKDQTAASALTALSKFSAEQLGLDRANSTKPLRRAVLRRDNAEAALLQAQAAHDDYLRLVAECERVESAARQAREHQQQCRLAFATAEKLAAARKQLTVARERADSARSRAAERRQRAAVVAERAERARELAAALPPHEPLATSGSQASSGSDELASQVARALGSWDALPAVVDLSGSTSSELRHQLEALPPPPQGATRVDPAIERLHEHYIKALAVAEALRASAAEAPDADDAGLAAVLEVDPATTARIADRLDRPAAEPEPRIIQAADAAAAQRREAAEAVAAADREESAAYAAARAEFRAGAQPSMSRSTQPAVSALAAVLAVVTIALVAFGQLPVALVLAGAGGAAAVALWRASRTIGPDGARSRVETSADARLDAARRQAQLARRSLADAEFASAQWALVAARNRLAQALGASAGSDTDVQSAYSAYERACESRAEQAQQAERRHALERQLTSRLAAERTAESVHASSSAAFAELRRLVDVVAPQPAGSAARSGEELAEALHGWLEGWGLDRDQVAAQREQRWELLTLTDGGSVEDVTADARAAGQQAAEAAAAQRAADADAAHLSIEVDGLAALAGVPDTDDDAVALLAAQRCRLEAAQQQERALDREAANLNGQLAERRRCLPDVAEAEEALERVERELGRLRSLADVLDSTIGFLRQARDETYTDLAPVLNRALERWLPIITDGRYRRATVDPRTLAVKVEMPSGDLRAAETLSVGTAEQVYLLLRIALTEHLAAKSAVSPLLLDDVTVQSDPARTAAILQMCKTLADDGRQIVLFAQEPSVAEWAELHLDECRDKLIKLSVPAAA
jgi:hypothetical protein